MRASASRLPRHGSKEVRKPPYVSRSKNHIEKISVSDPHPRQGTASIPKGVP